MLSDFEKKEALRHAGNGAKFYFEPYSSLSEKIAKGGEAFEGMGKNMKIAIMNKRAICIDTDMVIKYCKGCLDRKNSYILDNGNIRVISYEYYFGGKGGSDDKGQKKVKKI